MPLFSSGHQRAQLLIGALGIGLAFALWPYVTGLIGAAVLYVIFSPVHTWLARRLPVTGAALMVVSLAVLVIILPGLSVAGLVVNEAQQVAGALVGSPILSRLGDLKIGEFDVGPQLVSLGQAMVGWLGQSAGRLIGTAARAAINITIAMFGLYFMLLRRDRAWQAVSPYIPFSPANTAKLRQRFTDVTNSTLIGTGLTAVVQGALVGASFAVVGLPSAFFWGVVTAVFAILPLVGSGLVWGPGAIALFLTGRYLAAVGIAVWGLVIVASADNFIRPWVYNRWAKIHPLVTLVGALAGIRFFGILGLLIGPLALSYFFELIAMYREEYIADDQDRLVEEAARAVDVVGHLPGAGAGAPEPER